MEEGTGLRRMGVNRSHLILGERSGCCSRAHGNFVNLER